MKKTTVIAFLTLSLYSVFAGQGYVVKQQYTGSGANGAVVQVTWYITETQCKLKMEFADAKVNTVTWFIPSVQSNSLLTYTEGNVPAGVEKAYYTIPVSTVQADKSMNASRITVSKTGETKNISGILCEKVIIKTNKSTTEMWLTKDFKADFYRYFPYFQNSFELIGLFEEKIQGFPLLSTTKDNSGNVLASYQLITITPTELQDADFTVPADYKSASLITGGK